MSGTKFYLAAIVTGLLTPALASAQFFMGPPSMQVFASPGTITNQPAISISNITRKFDVTGQFQITDPVLSGLGTGSMEFSCTLDPAFNGGAPLMMQLQFDQSGFVDVPTGGQIVDWHVDGFLADTVSIVTGSDFHSGSHGPYSPGITNYNFPTIFSAPFLYDPLAGDELLFGFYMTFQNLSSAGVYTVDFPLTVTAVEVPEPASIAIIAACLPALLQRRRRSGSLQR